MSGIVASTVHNAIRNVVLGLVGEAGQGIKQTVPSDFMPSSQAAIKPKKKRINRKQIAANARIFLTAQAEARKGLK